MYGVCRYAPHPLLGIFQVPFVDDFHRLRRSRHYCGYRCLGKNSLVIANILAA